jgi:hypothetical protein
MACDLCLDQKSFTGVRVHPEQHHTPELAKYRPPRTSNSHQSSHGAPSTKTNIPFPSSEVDW